MSESFSFALNTLCDDVNFWKKFNSYKTLQIGKV